MIDLCNTYGTTGWNMLKLLPVIIFNHSTVGFTSPPHISNWPSCDWGVGYGSDSHFDKALPAPKQITGKTENFSGDTSFMSSFQVMPKFGKLPWIRHSPRCWLWMSSAKLGSQLPWRLSCLHRWNQGLPADDTISRQNGPFWVSAPNLSRATGLPVADSTSVGSCDLVGGVCIDVSQNGATPHFAWGLKKIMGVSPFSTLPT